MDFSDKTAIITGGTRGIGKAIADLLWEAGCNVIITGTSDKNEDCIDTPRYKYYQLDFLNKDSISSFVDSIKNEHKIDILINNAGINVIENIYEIKEENWDKIIQVNLTGVMYLTKVVSSSMIKNKKGKILNISSIFGVVSRAKRNSYSASKTGLIGLTRSSALDLAPHNRLVNALCPGFTLTELTTSVLSERDMNDLSQEVPLGRFAEVDEIAKTAVFLCSDMNTYMTGQTLIADGGFVIK